MEQANQATILLVEDDPDNLFIALELLRREVGGEQLHSSKSGAELFQLLEAEPGLIPDLILLDIQLPGDDGYLVLMKIRQEPRLQGTRVVAFTANVTPQNVARARAAGFDGFIGKPIPYQRFPKQIQRLLRGEAVWEAR